MIQYVNVTLVTMLLTTSYKVLDYNLLSLTPGITKECGCVYNIIPVL